MNTEARYNVDMFQTQLAKHCQGRVLTLEEVKERTKTVIDHTFVGNDENVKFYSTNHLFGYPLLPKNCVPCTTSIPRSVAPRPTFEDGAIDTAADQVRFEEYCNPKMRVIESIEELVDYLNQHS